MSYDSRPDTHEHIAQVRGLLLGESAERFGYGEEITRLLHTTVDAILGREIAA